jgi:hypothetical protein
MCYELDDTKLVSGSVAGKALAVSGKKYPVNGVFHPVTLVSYLYIR